MSLASASLPEINMLNASAAFAMSLGAKEIFHTNFLAFLLESDDPDLEPMQRAIRNVFGFPVTPGALSRCAVWREKNNRDLVIVELHPLPAGAAAVDSPTADEDSALQAVGEQPVGWDWDPTDRWRHAPGKLVGKSGTRQGRGLARNFAAYKVLIIEAKLKSIPSLEQLIKYDEHLANTGMWLRFPEDAASPAWQLPIGAATQVPVERVLLSVSGISMTTPVAGDDWLGVQWAVLQRAMNEAMALVAPSPVRDTLADYIQALGALVTLLDRVHRMCDHAHLEQAAQPTYRAMRMQALDKQFQLLRISDLLGKTLFDYWLNTYLAHERAEMAPPGWFWKSQVIYSRAVPGVTVELINTRFAAAADTFITLRIGVQIQGCEFRLFISADKDWHQMEQWIANHPDLITQWFGAPVCGIGPVGIKRSPPSALDGGPRSTNLRVFTVSRFVYSTVNIDNQAVTHIESEFARVLVLASALAAGLSAAA